MAFHQAPANVLANEAHCIKGEVATGTAAGGWPSAAAGAGGLPAGMGDGLLPLSTPRICIHIAWFLGIVAFVVRVKVLPSTLHCSPALPGDKIATG